MRQRRWITSVVLSVVVAVAAFVGVLYASYHPVLGLDLQGGASVVYRPTRKVSDSKLNETISILRNRVNAYGIADPSIGQQGSNIAVDLPGVKNPRSALAFIGQTAILQFRIVECALPNYTKPPKSLHLSAAELAPRCPTTTAEADSPDLGYIPTTPAEKAQDATIAVFPQIVDHKVVGRYVVGPTLMTGSGLKTATAAPDSTSLNGGWLIDFTLTSKDSPLFNSIASTYYHQDLAIVLDGQIQSAPQIDTKNFHGSGDITGNYTQKQAEKLALILRYGALPVQLSQETVQTISPTLGAASLRAGLIAGFAGLILVLLYTIFYYRLLGVVVLTGLATTFGAMWAILSLLGHTSQLTLNLSGVTGIIVAIGVIVDSYIVFFERLKDEAREGRSLRAAVDKGFVKAFRTIVAADLVSLIGAALLYYFSIGDVKGFAFSLGLATILDIASAWFFTRPLVLLLGSLIPDRHAGLIGVSGNSLPPEKVDARTLLLTPKRRGAQVAR